MPDFGKSLTLVSQHIRKLRGGSQPILAQTSDGLLYVVKFRNNLQGPNLLFNESVGSELYHACGLAGPPWKPLLVTDRFLDQNTDCWMETPEGPLRPESGLCFGSRFLGGEAVSLWEILPGTSLKRVANHLSFWLAWLIDVCAKHTDNRQAIFVEGAKGQFKAFFVDHGHLFSGPKGEQSTRFEASRYLDPRIYQGVSSQQILDFQSILGSLNMDRLWQRIERLPEDWKTASALGGFADCLNRLSNPRLLQGVLTWLVDAQERTDGFERGEYRSRRKPPVSVLRPGVQAAGLARRSVAADVDYLACA